MNAIKRLENLSSKKREMELFSLERRLEGNLVSVYKYLKGSSKEDRARDIPAEPSGR